MTAKEIKALLRENDTVTFKIKGLGDNLYVFSRTYFGQGDVHSIESVRLHDENHLLITKSMNVDTTTSTSLELYTFDMFETPLQKTLHFEEMYEIEAL